MSEYKVGDRVIVEESNVDHIYGSHKGKIGTVVSFSGLSYPYKVTMDFDGSSIWCKVAGYAEEKKMFTKSDLKTGMFGVMDNGFKFVVVDDHFVYSNGEWDRVSNLDDDLAMYSKKVMKVFEGINSFNILEIALEGDSIFDPIYDRERDTKKLYNGKVVCINNVDNKRAYTVGKIYQFNNGFLTGDNGQTYPGKSTEIYSFEDWDKWTASKFIEVVE